MDPLSLIDQFPHLATPIHLASADTGGRFDTPRHVAHMNSALMDVSFGDTERLIINMPFQHSKSWTASKYFPAWHLLLFPETRIILAAHSDRYAASFGAKVKDILERFGPDLGITLRQDTQAKDEWVIDGHEGGMVCKGRGGAVIGRAADMLILDDLIKDAEEAMSDVVLEKIWDWYSTVAYSRLGPTAPIIAVGTRWGKKDIFGRILDEAAETGEVWKVIRYAAIAMEDDPLGRKPGEALWPQRVPLKRLEMIRAARPRWFGPCWQQVCEDEEGAFFKPGRWPLYQDVGDAFVLQDGDHRQVLLKTDVIRIITADWATSRRASADRTAIGVFGLTPDGKLLVLEVIAQRMRLEECVPCLDEVCRRWRPHMVAAEATGFQAALADDARRYRWIPEVRRLETGNAPNQKIRRALPAIVLGENKLGGTGRIYLPRESARWLEGYKRELGAFTGSGNEKDDQVDITGYAAQIAQELRVAPRAGGGTEPVVLTPGKEWV